MPRAPIISAGRLVRVSIRTVPEPSAASTSSSFTLKAAAQQGERCDYAKLFPHNGSFP
jgi:hypothetical protein